MLLVFLSSKISQDSQHSNPPFQAGPAPGASLHSSFEGEGFAIPPSILDSADQLGIAPVTVSDLLPAIASLSMAAQQQQPSMGGHVAGAHSEIAGVSAHTIHSIASSLQNLPSVVGAGGGIAAAAGTERSSSRNSYSPTMSDSGISVDAASNSSGPAGVTQANPISAAALAKLGNINVNNQGMGLRCLLWGV